MGPAGVIAAPAVPRGSVLPAPALRRRVADLATDSLQVRLAETDADIAAAQALRYRVFYERMGARAPSGMAHRRDSDRFDAVCDHLLVIDRARPADSAIVGTYRLLRRAAAARLGGFYSESEYDLSPLIAHPGEILELGRSCVDPAYRPRPVLQLLWSGIAAYVFHHDIALMFGVASLPGIDPAALAVPLSYLRHHHLAPPGLRPRALAARYVAMGRCPPAALDPVRVFARLPPLIKGYLRLGGCVGDGAVIDRDFNTTDVCVIVETELVTERYSRHYGRQSREVGTA